MSNRNGKGLSWKGKDEHKNAMMSEGNVQSAIWPVNYDNIDVVNLCMPVLIASKIEEAQIGETPLYPLSKRTFLKFMNSNHNQGN